MQLSILSAVAMKHYSQKSAPKKAACDWSMPTRSQGSTPKWEPALKSPAALQQIPLRALLHSVARAAFIGTVADDEFGKIFAHDIRSIGVTFTAPPVARHRTDISFAYSRNARRRAHDEYVSRNIDQPRRKTARSRIDTRQRNSLSRRLSFRRTRCEASHFT